MTQIMETNRVEGVFFSFIEAFMQQLAGTRFFSLIFSNKQHKRIKICLIFK
jgi:hypothetical protein